MKSHILSVVTAILCLLCANAPPLGGGNSFAPCPLSVSPESSFTTQSSYAATTPVLPATLLSSQAVYAQSTVPQNSVGQGQTSSYVSSTRYARAEAHDVYFCQTRSTATALFTIPYTYCVEVLGEENGWYTVKYAEDYGIYRALYGYCPTASLTILSQKPDTVWLYKEVVVTYTAESSQGTLPVLDSITATAAFYGTYYSGPTPYAYVLCSSSFGYVSGTDISYPLNKIAEPDPEPEEDPDPKNDDSSSPSIGAIVSICLFAAAILLLLFFLSRKQKTDPNR